MLTMLNIVKTVDLLSFAIGMVASWLFILAYHIIEEIVLDVRERRHKNEAK